MSKPTLRPGHQLVAGRCVITLIDLNGDKFFVIDDGRVVPLEIARLAAGKDAWIRDIQVACADCSERVRLGDTENYLCPVCYDKLEREMLEENL